MPPVDPRELTAITAHTLVTDVLMPAAITAASDLSVQACVTTQRGQRPAAGDFQPVQPGWRWGPVWSTAWFTCSGTMPEGEGAPAVRFSSGTEALLIRDGEAWHGHLVGDKCTGAKGYKIVSEITLYGNRLHSMDQGYDDKGNMVWGSEGIYKFTRCIDPK